MSYRTRSKPLPKQRFSINHHFEYGASTSHFPNSYSMIGKEIKFPKSVVPLVMGHKFIFVGNIDEFFQTINTHQVDFNSITEASISIKGVKYQQQSTVANFGLFSISTFFVCAGYLSKLDSYRNNLYPKYRFDDYESIEKIIGIFSGVNTLIINIQDNDLTLSKTLLMQRAIQRSAVRKCVVRNLSYYMEVPEVDQFFEELKVSKDREFAFVWEKHVISNRSEDEIEE